MSVFGYLLTSERLAAQPDPSSSSPVSPATLDRDVPASAAMYGGQAVVEGVMMRGVRYFAVACRRANGQIALTCEPVPKILRPAWQKLPFVRGGFALVDSMALGTRALFWAAKVAEQDTRSPLPSPPPSGNPTQGPQNSQEIRQEATAALSTEAIPLPHMPARLPGGVPGSDAPSEGVPSRVGEIAIGSAMVVGLLSAIFLFKVLPQFGLELVKQKLGWETWQLGIADFCIRFTIFMGYILLVSRMEYVYRVFQYHGAEHKAINALEAGQDLTVENAAAASRLHPRCGTSFLFIVIFLSVLAISPFYGLNVWLRILVQLLVLFPVAGVSFELLRLAGKYRDNPVAAALSRPGMWTQYLTTREPDNDQVEVSLAALKAVIYAEKALDREEASSVRPENAPPAAVA